MAGFWFSGYSISLAYVSAVHWKIELNFREDFDESLGGTWDGSCTICRSFFARLAASYSRRYGKERIHSVFQVLVHVAMEEPRTYIVWHHVRRSHHHGCQI